MVRREPPTVIMNFQVGQPVLLAECEADLAVPGLRVAHHVGQRFVSNAIDRYLNRSGKRRKLIRDLDRNLRALTKRTGTVILGCGLPQGES